VKKSMRELFFEVRSHPATWMKLVMHIDRWWVLTTMGLPSKSYVSWVVP
jgi:hypothetical protein